MSTFMNISAWNGLSEESDIPSRASRSLSHLRSFSQSISSFGASNTPVTFPDAPRKADLRTPHNVYDPDADEIVRNLSLGSQSPTCSDSSNSVEESEGDDDEANISTLPDPRERSMHLSASSSLDSHDDRPSTSHTTATTDEITTISNKLVAAVNQQTALSDALAASREETRLAKENIARLEGVILKQQEMVTGDVWIRKTAYEAEKCDLIAKIGEEKRHRLDAEKAKQAMERELEELSTALFNEANNLVIAAKEEARKDVDIMVRQNAQLKAQVAETEDLLRDQQDQLAQLKVLMSQFATERDDHSIAGSHSPRSIRHFPSRDDLSVHHARDSKYLSPTATEHPASVHTIHNNAGPHVHLQPPPGGFVAASPTTFTNLLTPVLNTDITAFEEFRGLIHASSVPANRNSGGSFSGSSFMGASLSVGGVAGGLTSSAASIMSSAVSINSTASTSTMGVPQLKDLKFFKRALVEDIDPTLRMDSAVHISWLARRAAHAAVVEGTLVVEPVVSNEPLTTISHPHYYPCSMCGEKRKSSEFLRTHRFRYQDSETASRYPLCPYCLVRVRTTCEYVGFLRILKDGHWRSEDEEDEKVAWEESVRLREQMFWARVGGGVVPIVHDEDSEGMNSTAPSVIGVEPEDHGEVEADISLPSIVMSEYSDAVSEHAAPDTHGGNHARDTQRNSMSIPEEDEFDSASSYSSSDQASAFGPDAETPVSDTMEVKGIDEMDMPTPMPQDYSEISFHLSDEEPSALLEPATTTSPEADTEKDDPTPTNTTSPKTALSISIPTTMPGAW